jgi:CRP-like cAMP-binding protein
VAKTLLELAERSGALADGGSFRMARTQSEMAHELATSRESVARALSRLRKRGIIESIGRKVTIRSVRGLEDVARGEEPG